MSAVKNERWLIGGPISNFWSVLQHTKDASMYPMSSRQPSASPWQSGVTNQLTSLSPGVFTWGSSS
eukprot:6482322-Amphidinium_carterae.1